MGMTRMSCLRGLGCGRGVSLLPMPARRGTVRWRTGRLRGSWLLARVVQATARRTRWLRPSAEWIRKQTPAAVGPSRYPLSSEDPRTVTVIQTAVTGLSRSAPAPAPAAPGSGPRLLSPAPRHAIAQSARAIGRNCAIGMVGDRVLPAGMKCAWNNRANNIFRLSAFGFRRGAAREAARRPAAVAFYSERTPAPV